MTRYRIRRRNGRWVVDYLYPFLWWPIGAYPTHTSAIAAMDRHAGRNQSDYVLAAGDDPS